MKGPISFLYKNVGLFPLASAAVGGAIGFAVGATGRIAVDAVSFLYDNGIQLARNFPYSLQIEPNFISHIASAVENSAGHAVYDGIEGSAVYSAGSLLLAKKFGNFFRSRDRR